MDIAFLIPPSKFLRLVSTLWACSTTFSIPDISLVDSVVREKTGEEKATKTATTRKTVASRIMLNIYRGYIKVMKLEYGLGESF